MAKYCGRCGSLLDENGLCPRGCNAQPPAPEPDRNTGKGPDAWKIGASRGRNDPSPTPPAVGPTGGSHYPVPPVVGPTGTVKTAQPAAEPEPEVKPKKKTKLILIFAGIVVFLLAVLAGLFALAYFDVVQIPVVSGIVEKLTEKDPAGEETTFGSDEGETEPEKTERESETETGTPQAEETTTAPAVKVTLSGVLTEETYRRNGTPAGTYYLLTTEEENTFSPPAPYDAIYGRTVAVKTVQILTAPPEEYLGLHVTVSGEVDYASEDAHRETVLLKNCRFEFTEEDNSLNAKSGNVGRQVTIRLDKEAGKDAVILMRDGPGYNYEIVGRVRTGTAVTVLEEKNIWVRVEYEKGKEGWCNGIVAGFDLEFPPRDEIPVDAVSCSSDQGVRDDGRRFTPDMAADKDPDTCWMAVGGKGGAGNWIRFEFASEQTVSGVEFINGNCWDGVTASSPQPSDLFHINGRIKEFTLTFSDGSTETFLAKDEQETRYGANIFYFDKPVRTDSITLYVDSGYPGDKWDSVVCLAEFAAFR